MCVCSDMHLDGLIVREISGIAVYIFITRGDPRSAAECITVSARTPTTVAISNTTHSALSPHIHTHPIFSFIVADTPLRKIYALPSMQSHSNTHTVPIMILYSPPFILHVHHSIQR
jgi:hypothetical protein